MSTILKSVFGRLLGLDASSYVTSPIGCAFPEMKAGPSGTEVSIHGANSVQTLTSGSTATVITAGGYTALNSSSSLSWVMAAPIKGVHKTVATISTAGGACTVRLSTSLGGNFYTTAGSSFQAFILNGIGETLNVVGLSTAIWMVLNTNSSQAPTT